MQEILQYIQKNTLFHRLNTFTKILFMVIVMIMSVLTTDVTVLFLIVIAIFFISWVSRLHRELFNQVHMILAMSVSLTALTVLTQQTGTIITYLIPSWVPYLGPALPITLGALDFSAVPDSSVRCPHLRIPARDNINPATGHCSRTPEDAPSRRLHPNVPDCAAVYPNSPVGRPADS